jgi:hypothetical protein
MYCPKCKYEYLDGIKVCPDCDVALVPQLPPEPEVEFVDFQEVLATYNPADVAFLKSLLGSENIQYFFKGEHFMYMRPLADPVRLMVRTDQVETVKAILKDIELSITGINLGKNKP